MSETELSIESACYLAVHEYPGKVAAVAATFSWNAGTLNNKLNPRVSSHKLLASEVESILQLTQDPRILDAMCAQVPGTIWFNLGSVDGEPCDMAMLDNITEMIDRVGKLAGKVRESLEDGNVNPQEARELETATIRTNQAVQAVFKRVKQFR